MLSAAFFKTKEGKKAFREVANMLLDIQWWIPTRNAEFETNRYITLEKKVYVPDILFMLSKFQAMHSKHCVVTVQKESIFNVIVITSYFFRYDWSHKTFILLPLSSLYSVAFFHSYCKFEIIFFNWKQQECGHGLIPYGVILISGKRCY